MKTISILLVSLFFCSMSGLVLAKHGGGIKFSVTASAGPNGKIKPAGTKQIKQGGSKTYKATPNTGFKAAILLDGGTVVAGTTSTTVQYTLTNVQAAHTIQAVF